VAARRARNGQRSCRPSGSWVRPRLHLWANGSRPAQLHTSDAAGAIKNARDEESWMLDQLTARLALRCGEGRLDRLAARSPPILAQDQESGATRGRSRVTAGSVVAALGRRRTSRQVDAQLGALLRLTMAEPTGPAAAILSAGRKRRGDVADQDFVFVAEPRPCTGPLQSWPV